MQTINILTSWTIKIHQTDQIKVESYLWSSYSEGKEVFIGTEAAMSSSQLKEKWPCFTNNERPISFLWMSVIWYQEYDQRYSKIL